MLNTRPLRSGSPSASSVSYTTAKRSSLRRERWKSMLPEKISATCMATASGMLAASVAANNELRITPPARRVPLVRGAVSIRETKPSPLRSTTSRRKVPLSSGAQRAVRRTRLWSSVVSAETRRPARPSKFWRTVLSERKNAAAAGSATPMRCSSDSAVSLLRVCSDRYSEKPGASSASRERFSARDSTG